MRRNNILSKSMDELRSEYSYDIVSTPTNSINNKSNSNSNNNNYMTNNHNYSNIRKFSKPGYIPNNRNCGMISNKTRRLSQTSRPKQYSMDNLLTIENISFDENEEDYHQVLFQALFYTYTKHILLVFN